ncbi:MAG: DNA polymerase subunit beta [Bacteroidetes bacterium]|nr:MAG: DNA polymerase subunit beta [Bacteroidota bacterium]
MLTKSSIIESLKLTKPNLSVYGVKKIGLFGSYARNTQLDISDIDILVDLHSDQETFDNLMSIYDILENTFDGYKVEVVTKNGLSKHIGTYILEETVYV